MKKNIISLAIASLFGLTALAASAEEAYEGSWYLVPGASYMNTDSDLEADNGGGAFIRLGKELSEHWDVQFGLAHNRADEDLNVAGLNSSGKYKQTSLGLDALYMFSRDKFRPFLLAGLGVARNDIDYKLAGVNIGDEKTSWMANVGVGAQYMFSEMIGLQADVRHVWSRAEADANVAGTRLSDEGTIGNTLLNLGGIIKFGAPKQVAAVEPTPEPAPAPAVEPTPEPAPAPAPAPEPVVCKPTMETITVAAEKLFGFDKSALKDEGKAALDAAAAKLVANPDIELVLVTGHTDLLGSDTYNQKLSERRANQVKDYLVSQGVAASRLQAVGKGESEPVVDCAGVKGRKKLIECLQPNRRVVLSAEKQRETGCK